MWLLAWLYNLLILLSSHNKLNPEHKGASISNMSICHWNLNSISAHNYTNLLLLIIWKFHTLITLLRINECCLYLLQKRFAFASSQCSISARMYQFRIEYWW